MMSMMGDKFQILSAYCAKRWTLRSLRNRADIDSRQQRLLGQLMHHASGNIPFYAAYTGTAFSTWPIIDKATMLQEFGSMNSRGLSSDLAWQIAEQGLKSSNSSGSFGDLTIGTSTGTSGQRGLFVVSSHERALWLGSILARCLPDFPVVKHRVAVMLATGNELYQTASASGRLAFSFFDLRQGLECHAAALQAFNPDVLVAPPKAARALAEANVHLNLKHLFAGGEVLDPLDAAPIKQWCGVRPRSLYQATEGFLGVECGHGRIHLNEDDMLIEEEPISGHEGHFVPVITDLRRRAQALIRYRLNDVLVKAPGACACGSPFMSLLRVEGRCDDMLVFRGERKGQNIKVMPDALRAVILDSDRSITDFRLVQKTEGRLTLQLAASITPHVAERAKADLIAYFFKIGVSQQVTVDVSFGIEIIHVHKLRRIRSEVALKG